MWIIVCDQPGSTVHRMDTWTLKLDPLGLDRGFAIHELRDFAQLLILTQPHFSLLQNGDKIARTS